MRAILERRRRTILERRRRRRKRRKRKRRRFGPVYQYGYIRAKKKQQRGYMDKTIADPNKTHRVHPVIFNKFESDVAFLARTAAQSLSWE